MTPVIHIPFVLPASDDELLWCDARFPAEAVGPLPVLLFLHGFKGFKDWGAFPWVGEELARRGFYVVTMNFSHNGTEGHGSEFTRLDRFERNTFSREVREACDMVSAIAASRTPHAEKVDSGRIGVIGHSRGGGIALLASERSPRVVSVATWAAVSSFNRYTPAQIERWRSNGVLESKNMRTGQMMRLGLELLEDLEVNAASLDIERAVRSLARPLLVLHGEMDLSVLIENGRSIASWGSAEKTQFEAVPRTNHTFGAAHPFGGPGSVLVGVVERTAEFFHHTLAGG